MLFGYSAFKSYQHVLMIAFSVDSLLDALVFHEAGLLRCLFVARVATFTFPLEAVDRENVVQDSFDLDGQGRVGIFYVFGMRDSAEKFQEFDVFEAIVLLFPDDFIDESHLAHTEAESDFLIRELHL